MSATYWNILRRVKRFCKADALEVITKDDYKDSIEDAIEFLSNDKPEHKCVSLANSSDGFYDLPDDYDTENSRITEVEYPIDENPKCVVEGVYFEVDQFPTGYKLRFNLNNPSDTFYLRYTIPYTLEDDGTSNVPDKEVITVAFKASALVCEILASHFATKTDSNLPELAEMIKYDGRVGEWARRAAHYEKLYQARIAKKRRVSGVMGNTNSLTNDKQFFRTD